MLARCTAVVLITPTFIFPSILITLLGALLGQIYLGVKLWTKRELSNARAPVLAHLGAAMQGLREAVISCPQTRADALTSNHTGLQFTTSLRTRVLSAHRQVHAYREHILQSQQVTSTRRQVDLLLTSPSGG